MHRWSEGKKRCLSSASERCEERREKNKFLASPPSPSVLLNFGRTEKMLAVCGGKTNILPTSFQHTIHKEPMFSPAPHLLGGVNVERMFFESEWLILEWARCGKFLRTPLKVPVS